MLVCTLLLASVARADGTNRTSDDAPKPDARALYEQGIRRYNVAEYDAAIDYFKQAYVLTNAPELLFNIAQAYRLKGPGNCATALHFYENYLRIEPQTSKRASVDAAILDMRACAKNEPPAPADSARATPSPTPPPPKPPEREAPAAATQPPHAADAPPTSWPLILGTTGLAVAAAGGALVVWSKLRYDSISASGCAPSCDSRAVDGPRTAQTVGDVLLVAGAATAATGLVVWFLGRPGATGATASVMPTLRGVRAEIRF